MEKKLRIGNLYEFYGQLLTDKQQEILELYCSHDLSFGEISEELGVSRQAVYDTIKRSEKTLDEYESKLELVKRFLNREVIIKHMISQLDLISENMTEHFSLEDIRGELEKLKIESMEMLE